MGMVLALPFTTFGQAASFDLEVEVSCRCGRRVVIDHASPLFRNRSIMGTSFTCTTVLVHGERCRGTPTIYIRKRGRAGWRLGDHSRALRSRHVGEPVPSNARTFLDVVRRGEVAHFYEQGCNPSYTIADVQLDEAPWNRFLDQPIERFVCPRCRKGLIMHLHYSPGVPATERFHEQTSLAAP